MNMCKLIDEVAGIMKSAGADDEKIRTAIAKMEKLAYDKSKQLLNKKLSFLWIKKGYNLRF